MPIVSTKPTSPGRRHLQKNKSSVISGKNTPHKPLLGKTGKRQGRNNAGRITVRHRGGGHKRKLRIIDFKRNKIDVPGKVISIEYDPNRTANIALVSYQDGDKKYILAPMGLKTGHKILSGTKAELKPGNALPLEKIHIGMQIHNIELRPGKGGQLVRGAGNAAILQSKEGGYATILLPSKEVRLVSTKCFATIGQVGNMEHKNIKIGKAGRKRHMGIRPTVRGVAQHPGSHPHGGGEGRSGIGMKSPKTPWGKKTLGKKTRAKTKYSDKYIVKDRRLK